MILRVHARGGGATFTSLSAVDIFILKISQLLPSVLIGQLSAFSTGLGEFLEDTSCLFFFFRGRPKLFDYYLPYPYLAICFTAQDPSPLTSHK